MKLTIVLLACVACLVVVSGKASVSRGPFAEESKTQPKEVVLAKDKPITLIEKAG